MNRESLYYKLKIIELFRKDVDIVEILNASREFKNSSDPVEKFINTYQTKGIDRVCRTNNTLKKAVPYQSEPHTHLSITEQLKGLKKSFFPKRVNKKHNKKVLELESILGGDLSYFKTKGLIFPDNFITSTIETAIVTYGALELTGHPFTSTPIMDNTQLLGTLAFIGLIGSTSLLNYFSNEIPTQKAEYIDSVISKLEVENYNKSL